MKPITREQRQAIKRVFQRCPIYPNGKSSDQLAYENGWQLEHVCGDDITYSWQKKGITVSPDVTSAAIVEAFEYAKPISYMQFRRTVQQGYDCLMVQWAGMWLGIEADGHTHS